MLAIVYSILLVWGAQVTQMKGKKIILKADAGETLNVGDEYEIRNGPNVIATVKIQKLSGNRALAQTLEGQPKIGATAIPVNNLINSNRSSPYSKALTSHLRYYLLWGYHQHSITVPNARGGADISLKGTNLLNIFGEAQYLLNSQIRFGAKVGYLGFNLKGSVTGLGCSSSTDCKIDITYVPVGGYVEYIPITSSAFSLFTRIGYEQWVAISKSTNIDNLNLGGSNQAIPLSFGAYYNISKTGSIPVSLNYYIFPGLGSIKLNSLSLNIGYQLQF